MPTPIRTEPVFDALKQPLALIDNDDRRRGIEAYIEAAHTPVERAVFDLMSQIVQAIDDKVGSQYRVRLAYRPEGLQVEVDEKTGGNGDDARWSTLEGDVEKITIRIPAELKDLAQQAASKAGTSANTWFIKALARAVRNIEVQAGEPHMPQPPRPPSWDEQRGRRRGSRLTGWIGGDDE